MWADARRARRWLRTWTAVTLCSASLAFSQTNDHTDDEVILDEIVAKVNTEIITLTDLRTEEDRLRRQVQNDQSDPAQRAAVYEREHTALLRALIINKMVIQRGEELGMTANIETDVNKAIQDIKDRNGIPDDATLDRLLHQQGSSLAEFRDSLRERMIVERVYSNLVYSKIAVLTQEIEQYYKDHIAEFTEPATVELAEILFLTEGKDHDLVQRKAQEVLDRLKAGEDFADLAREFSDGTTAAQGGKLPPFQAGTLNEAIETAARDLAPGQCSGLVQADYGYTILKVISRTEAKARPLEEVHDEIALRIRQEKAQPEVKTFLDTLRDQSYVYVAPKYREMFDLGDLF